MVCLGLEFRVQGKVKGLRLRVAACICQIRASFLGIVYNVTCRARPRLLVPQSPVASLFARIRGRQWCLQSSWIVTLNAVWTCRRQKRPKLSQNKFFKGSRAK